jgi:hypothetical protein
MAPDFDAIVIGADVFGRYQLYKPNSALRSGCSKPAQALAALGTGTVIPTLAVGIRVVGVERRWNLAGVLR